jgi:plastocyanin
MVGTLLNFAADEPSKVPFYVAGIAFATWAVILAFLGLSRASFPGGARGGSAVIGISVLLAAAAIGTAIGTGSTEKPEEAKPGEAAAARQRAAAKAPEAPTPSRPAAAPLELAADPTGQLRYDRKTLRAAAGKVTIDFTNASGVGHDVTVAKGPSKLGGTKVITKSKAAVSLDLKPGSYVFYCSVPGHRQAGMQGTLTIA